MIDYKTPGSSPWVGDERKSQACLSWLEAILLERFGHRFSLQAKDGGERLRLQIAGAEGCVDFDTLLNAFSKSASDIQCTVWDAEVEGWHSVLGAPLPAPGVAQLPAPLIEKERGGHVIHYDILGLTYWMLSRLEEVGRADLDEHDRFPATSSHAFKYGYLERPVVDEWLLILKQVIMRQWSGIALKQHQFSIKVSHDVDTPSRSAFHSPKQLLRMMAGDIFRRKDLHAATMAFRVWERSRKCLHPSDPMNTFEWLMDVSEHNGLHSAFYFICGRTVAAKDALYEVEHPAITTLMRQIDERGHEIGLHPSYGTYQDPNAIAAEASRLRQVCAEVGIEQRVRGGRMHYLRWEHPTTMLGWVRAGMSYDSTLSYADRPGFRCGTCFEYPAFDPIKGEVLTLRIRPLIAMECTVMAERYMDLGYGAYEKFTQLKNTCQSVKGCFTLLWHNSYFPSDLERELYQGVLEA